MGTTKSQSQGFDPSQVLVSAESSAEALRVLYSQKKAGASSFSLEVLARKLGSLTKGNLSDIMQGRRKISPKHVKKLCAVLGLEGINATFFTKLVEHDSTRREDLKTTLAQEISLLRKTLSIQTIENSMSINALGIQVFCAFGLFRNEPSLQDLLGYFKNKNQSEIQSALNDLMRENFIIEDSGKYALKAHQLKFKGLDANSAQLVMLSQSLEEARHLARRFWKSELSLFNSTIISVRKEDYIKVLQEFRETLYKYHSSLESSEANMLVRFNAQVYPLD